MRIAKVKGLFFEIPDNKCWYSFYNSPYLGHKLGTAIDIYYPDKAVFPFEEGKVKDLKKIRTQRHAYGEFDFLTIVEVNDFCLKILHVKPSVKVEERLYLGDEIGELIFSWFFRPWSDLHAHFELRDCRDKYRVRGGFLIEPMVLEVIPSIKGSEFEIVECKEHHYWLQSIHRGEKNLTPLTYQGTSLEGGLPYYHYGVVFGDMDHVEIFGKEIQLKEKFLTNAEIFEIDFEVFADDQKVGGIGIYCNQKKLKLIGGDFREGDIVQISFR